MWRTPVIDGRARLVKHRLTDGTATLDTAADAGQAVSRCAGRARRSTRGRRGAALALTATAFGLQVVAFTILLTLIEP